MKIEILARKHDGIVITHYPSGHEADLSKATFIKDTFDDIELTIDKVRSWLILEKIGVVIPEEIRRFVGLLYRGEVKVDDRKEEAELLAKFIYKNYEPNSMQDFFNAIKAISGKHENIS